MKAIKEGRTPTPGPPEPERHEEEEDEGEEGRQEKFFSQQDSRLINPSELAPPTESSDEPFIELPSVPTLPPVPQFQPFPVTFPAQPSPVTFPVPPSQNTVQTPVVPRSQLPVSESTEDVNRVFDLDHKSISDAQKFARFAISALQYDDIETAVQNLQKSIELLNPFLNKQN